MKKIKKLNLQLFADPEIEKETEEVYQKRIDELSEQVRNLQKEKAELFVALNSKEFKQKDEEPRYKSISDEEILAEARKGKK